MKTPSYTIHLEWRIAFPSLLMVLLLSVSTYAQVHLVADLNPGPPIIEDDGEGNHYFSYHSANSGRSFFFVDQVELWTSDGTAHGTLMVRKFLGAQEMISINGVAYLTARTEEHGHELWRSDGTLSGTYLLKDIYPGSGSSAPAHMVNFNGQLFFSANNRTNGRELWKSDGTPSGTQLVADLNGSTISSNPSKMTVAGNKLFFVANNGVDGYELFVSDGTTAGTSMVKNINTEPGAGSAPGELTNVNGLLLFSAKTPSEFRQLWKSDGTPEGTQLVKQIRYGDAQIGKMVSVNGTAFFQANDLEHGLELWKSDGTAEGTQLVKDITPGPGSKTQYATDHLNDLSAGLGRLFFTAVSEGLGQSLWVSDGTEEGTYPITDVDVGFSFSTPGFREFNGAMYFLGVGSSDYDSASLFKTDGFTATKVKENVSYIWFGDPLLRAFTDRLLFASGDRYWQSDGTTDGTFALKNIRYPQGSFPEELTNVNGTLYFKTGSGSPGLWKTNGTPETTTKVKDLVSLETLTSIGNKAYFVGVSLAPYVTDGTEAGTFQLSSEARHPRDFTGANGLVFFTAYNMNGEELWQTDGTVAGTKMTKDINAGPSHGGVSDLTRLNNTLFFRAYSPASGSELWKSNGTPEGTVIVKDINPGAASSAPTNPIAFGGSLYFYANDGVHGTELWRSDGTANGTHIVYDVRTDDLTLGSDLGNMTATPQFIAFSALNAENNVSIWKSNGTSAGTLKLVDLQTSVLPQIIAATGTHVFFIVTFEGYRELWSTNGTPAGTRKLRKTNGGYVDSFGKVAVLNNVMYMSYPEGILRSNGHYSGTYVIPVVGGASDLTTSGSLIYFSGNTRADGRELFALDQSVAATSIEADVMTGETEVLSTYPNPFSSTFSIHVSGTENETFSMSVMTANGQRVSDLATLPCNQDHLLGSSWKPGLYIVQIRQNNKVSTKKMIKTK